MAGVYLIFYNRLFRDAVRAILATHPEIELLGATDRPDVAAAEVGPLAANVVLLEESDGAPPMAGMERILANPATSRLITVRLDGDGMHVWSGSWRHMLGSSDLVQAIVGAGEDGA